MVSPLDSMSYLAKSPRIQAHLIIASASYKCAANALPSIAMILIKGGVGMYVSRQGSRAPVRVIYSFPWDAIGPTSITRHACSETEIALATRVDVSILAFHLGLLLLFLLHSP